MALALPAVLVLSLAALTAARVKPQLPDASLNLRLKAPITTWDEAIPLGNGLVGGLLWGQDGTLRLSLDRGDLWDERPAEGVPWDQFTYATMVRLVGEGRTDEFSAIFDRPYSDAHPTKIPAGRLEVDLAEGQHLTSFELNLASAEGRAWLDATHRAETFFSARQPVALLRLPGPPPRTLRLLPPASVAALDYPPAQSGREGDLQWFVQTAADGLHYCVLVGQRAFPDATLLAVTVTSTHDGPDPRKLAADRVTDALEAGYDKLLQAHQTY